MSVTAELAAFLGADSLVMSTGAVVLALRLAPRASVAAPKQANGNGTKRPAAGPEAAREPVDVPMAEAVKAGPDDRP